MITLIDELKTLDRANQTREMLDKVEKLNFIRPDLSPRVDFTREAMGLSGDNMKALHKLNEPTIAVYHHARLLYNMVNDDVRTREEARLSGEEELKNFIGSAKNLEFFEKSEDVHLVLAASFIRKTQNWIGESAGGGMNNGLRSNKLDMFMQDDDVDIE